MPGSDLQKFVVMPKMFDGKDIPIIQYNSKVYVVAQHVAMALGYKDTRPFVQKASTQWGLVADKHLLFLNGQNLKDFRASMDVVIDSITTSGDELISKFAPSILLLTEAGVRKAAIRSGMPATEAFIDWLVDEVLPGIAKAGTYSLPGARSRESLVWDYKVIIDIWSDPRLTALFSKDRAIREIEEATAIIKGTECVPSKRLVSITEYLMERGVSRAVADARCAAFGKLVAAAYRTAHNVADPPSHPRNIGGLFIPVFCYTDDDRPLLDAMFAKQDWTVASLPGKARAKALPPKR